MQQTDPAHAQAIAMAMLPLIGFGVIVFWAILIVPFWVIFKKAGFSGALSLLMLLPLVNLVMLYVLAFSRWRVVPAGPEYPTYPGYPAGPYVPPGAAAVPYSAPGYVPPASSDGFPPSNV